MADAYSQIPLHSSSPLNPTPHGYDGPPLASRILYGDSSAVTKMMDGIFLGGIEAGQDLDFCAAHKITHVVNCSGSSDILSQYGLKYLSLRWLDGGHGPGSVMFDPQGRNIQRIFKFIEACRSKGEGVLIHSMDGNSRAIGVMMAYLMRKLRWGMTKCLEYIRLKRPNIHPSPVLLKQLARAAQYLNLNPNDQQTTFAQRWMHQVPGASALETLLHNTFMNGHAIPVHAPGSESQARQFAQLRPQGAGKKRLIWTDEAQRTSSAGGTSSNSSLRRSSLRRADDDDDEDDDEDEMAEREANQRMMHRSLGVHYPSGMMNSFHNGALSSPSHLSSSAGLIRPGGAHYGPRPTSNESASKSLLKMRHLQPQPHFSWSINLTAMISQYANGRATHANPASNATATTPIASAPPTRPPSGVPKPAPAPAPSPLNGGVRSLTSSNAPSPLGSPLNSATRSNYTDPITASSLSAASRSAWTPDLARHLHGTTGGLSETAHTAGSMAGFSDTTTTTSSSFTTSVPGKPVVPSYRPSSSHAPVAAPSLSTATATLRGSSSVDEIADAMSSASVASGASNGAARLARTASAPSQRPATVGGATSTVAPSSSPLPSPHTLGASSLQSSPHAQSSPLISASVPASPVVTSASFTNGLGGRPLRSASASTTPTSSTSNLSIANGASQGAPSAYTFMPSPTIDTPQSHHTALTASDASKSSYATSSSLTGSISSTPVSSSRTNGGSLGSGGVSSSSSSSSSKPMLQSSPLRSSSQPVSTAPRLATLLQGGTGANTNSSAPSATPLTGPSGGTAVAADSDLRNSASSFAASRARGSAPAPGAYGQSNVSGGSTGSTFLASTYSYPPASQPHSSPSSFTPSAPFYRAPTSVSSAAFASSGIAVPHASAGSATGTGASASSGVIQWWVQDTKSSASSSVSGDAGVEKVNGASSASGSSSGAYPTAISSQSMMMFQKTRPTQSQGYGGSSTGGASFGTPQKSSTGSLSAAAAAAASGPSALAIGSSSFQSHQASTSASLSLAASQKLKSVSSASSSKSPSGSGVGAKPPPTSAPGFYSPAGSWSSTAGAGSTQTSNYSTAGHSPSPYAFLAGGGSTYGGGVSGASSFASSPSSFVVGGSGGAAFKSTSKLAAKKTTTASAVGSMLSSSSTPLSTGSPSGKSKQKVKSKFDLAGTGSIGSPQRPTSGSFASFGGAYQPAQLTRSKPSIGDSLYTRF